MFGLFDFFFGSSKKKQVVFENEKPTSPKPVSRNFIQRDVDNRLDELNDDYTSRLKKHEEEQEKKRKRDYDAVDLAVDLVETAIVIDLVSDLFSGDSSSSDSTGFDTTSTDTTDWSGDGGGFSGGGASGDW